MFWRDGYVVLPRVFAASEVACLRRAIVDCSAMTARADAARAKFAAGEYPSFETISVWNDCGGDDIFAQFTRRREIWETLEYELNDSIYVYHAKVAVKYPGVPGFRFHQDYAYWYKMGCLYPDMAACYVAVDRATEANGCLKIVEGSHRLGRIDHVDRVAHSDSGADPERLADVLARLPIVNVELSPGDAVLFHCCALHGSDANNSEEARLALLGCYNTRHNDPCRSDSGHPRFTAQEPLDGPVTEADVGRLPDFG